MCVIMQRAAWFQVMLMPSDILWQENEKHKKIRGGEGNGEEETKRDSDKQRVIYIYVI